MEKPILAIIVPCYNEQEIINTTYTELTKILDNLKNSNKISENSYLSFVDDGSTDKTWEIIKTLNIKGIKLSTNFGQQRALIAGICENKADIYVNTDADLQDDISVIEQMVDKYKEGFDIVYGVRSNRDCDSFLKKLYANFYYILNKFFNMNTISQHAEFRLISDKIAKQIKNLKETNIYLRGIISNLGFKSTKIYHRRLKRVGGKTKYNFYKLAKIAAEGITSFSTTPLKLVWIFGLIGLILSLIFTIQAICLNSASIFHRLLISVYFIGSIQLFAIGIIGEYIGKIYFETKQRPKYIIEEKTNV